MSTRLLVTFYLGALVAANLLVLRFGQVALFATALLLIPYDFAIRVRLQEKWRAKPLQLWLRMLVLMVTGGVLTWLLSPESVRIAVAGVSAFLLSSMAGTVVYEVVRKDSAESEARAFSLVAMAIFDTWIFSSMAFDAVEYELVVLQIVLKSILSYQFLKRELV